MKLPRLQLHLSTLVLLTVLAGAFIGVNICPRKVQIDEYGLEALRAKEYARVATEDAELFVYSNKRTKANSAKIRAQKLALSGEVERLEAQGCPFEQRFLIIDGKPFDITSHGEGFQRKDPLIFNCIVGVCVLVTVGYLAERMARRHNPK